MTMRNITNRYAMWFATGFVSVFVLMLFFVKMLQMHPSGAYLVNCSLLDYYQSELGRLGQPRTLEPAGESNLGLVFAQHLISALVGGGVFLLGAFGFTRLFRSPGPKKADECTH